MEKMSLNHNKKRCIRRCRRKDGFTLVEVLVSVSILVFVILGVMKGFLYFGAAGEIAGNKVKVVMEAQNKIEEIRNENFDNVYSTYNGTAFVLTQVNGMGVIEIDNTDPELLEIEIVMSWESRDGRIIGEDKNFNGVLDAGEDENSNGVIDSPLTIRTLMTRR